MFARISYTWQLMGASLSVLKRDKALVLFPLFSGIACILVIASFIAPLFMVFFNLRIVGSPWQLILVMFLGTWALVGNGAFFAAMSLRTRNRELMLPLLLFPISIPALLAMVGATTAVLTGSNEPDLGIKFLAVYNIVFTTAALLLFETVLEAE